MVSKSVSQTIHPLLIIISENLHFKFIQSTMNMIFIIDHIPYLMNESFEPFFLISRT